MVQITSDAELFLEMKKHYLEKRGRWSRFNYLVKPKTVEFIQASNSPSYSTVAVDNKLSLVHTLEFQEILHIGSRPSEVPTTKKLFGL